MIEYFNIAAVAWLTFSTLATANQIQNHGGRNITGVNMVPLVLSITSLITLGIHVIKDVIA